MKAQLLQQSTTVFYLFSIYVPLIYIIKFSVLISEYFTINYGNIMSQNAVNQLLIQDYLRFKINSPFWSFDRFTYLVPTLLFLTVSSNALFAQNCSAPSDINKYRFEHLGKLNALRKRQNIPIVSNNKTLDQIAQDYACLLAETGHFDHIGPNGSTLAERAREGSYNYCQIAENLAVGQQSVDEALIGWITSNGHWKNLIRETVNETGFGVAYLDNLGGAFDGEPRNLSELSMSLNGNNNSSEKRSLSATRKYVWVQLFGKRCK